jgi:hypothetical protein
VPDAASVLEGGPVILGSRAPLFDELVREWPDTRTAHRLQDVIRRAETARAARPPTVVATLGPQQTVPRAGIPLTRMNLHPWAPRRGRWLLKLIRR